MKIMFSSGANQLNQIKFISLERFMQKHAI